MLGALIELNMVNQLYGFQITPGSKASTANLCPGDVILAIDGYNTENMTHNDAQERIKAASHQLCLKIQRYLIMCMDSCFLFTMTLTNQFLCFKYP